MTSGVMTQYSINDIQTAQDEQGDNRQPNGATLIAAHLADPGGVTEVVVFDADIMVFVEVVDVEDGGMVVVVVALIHNKSLSWEVKNFGSVGQPALCRFRLRPVGYRQASGLDITAMTLVRYGEIA